MRMESMNIVGVMSGTSLDGLDLAFCTFRPSGLSYSFECSHVVTYPYPISLAQDLADAIDQSDAKIAALDVELGKFIGNKVQEFLNEHQLQADAISSHGHTIFHQPEKGITHQIGDGQEISNITGVSVINDFRSLDVTLGGQGAPLVPIGDQLLFGEFDYCLNLGGIANISMQQEGKMIAWDICPLNLVLNHLAHRIDLAYDKGGKVAASGTLQSNLLQQLNQFDYYTTPPPKSLGLEWVKAHVFPLLDEKLSTADLLHTCCVHMAQQITAAMPHPGKLLITGGGAYNTFLIDQIISYTNGKIDVVVPEQKIIEFKEAIIFGFLGYLRWNNSVNVLSSVTGASKDSVSGNIIHPKQD